MGRFGQKTGAGWYRYEKGDRTPYPDPIVEQVIKEVSASLGVTRRSFSDEEILRRLLLSSLVEWLLSAARIVPLVSRSRTYIGQTRLRWT